MTTEPAAERPRDDDLGAWFERAINAALSEDLGGHGPEADVTTKATTTAATNADAVVVAKQAGVVCGLAALGITFSSIDRAVTVTLTKTDGDHVEPEDVLARISGPARAILTGERTALNLLGHLSGIATFASAFVARAPGVQVTDTRKTLPGLRALEKYAVHTGGGTNHRFALWDGVLVKDNHIVAAGGAGEATRRARHATTLPIQVECMSREEVDEALDAGASSLLLDNRPPDELRALVAHVRQRDPNVFIEASGGVTLDTIADIAATGVDRVSIGALTHSAPALDVSLRFERVNQR